MPLNQAIENTGEIPVTGPAVLSLGGSGPFFRHQRKEMTTNDDENSPMFGHESNGINRIRRKKPRKMMTK